MSKGKRKTTAADADYLTVVVGGSYVADKAMAAKLAKGDRPAWDDIRPLMKRVEPGDRVRPADLHPWTLDAMIEGGFFGDLADADVPFSPPEPADMADDTDQAEEGRENASQWPWEADEEVTDGV